MYGAEILHDTKADSGREITWKQHRLVTLRLAQAYKRINSPKYHRVVSCGSFLVFRKYSDNALRLNSAYFCQTRLCPMCAWRKSKRTFMHVHKIMDALGDNYDYLFLTLTCKNVRVHELNSKTDNMFAAFKTLCLRKRFISAVRGWCRSYEITYNWHTGEFHPHFHAILVVNKDYYTSGAYITQDEWCKLWKSCLHIDYKPIVDIRTLQKSAKGSGKEIAEIAKYAVKPASVLADLREVSLYSKDIQNEVRRHTDIITDNVVYTLDTVLTRRRLLGYGGIMKAKHRELNLQDSDADLIFTGAGEVPMCQDFVLERYRWCPGYRESEFSTV